MPSPITKFLEKPLDCAEALHQQAVGCSGLVSVSGGHFIVSALNGETVWRGNQGTDEAVHSAVMATKNGADPLIAEM